MQYQWRYWAAFLIAVLLAVAGLGGCANMIAAPTAKLAKAPEKHLRFIFITTCVEEDFFKPVKKGMRDAAKMMDVDCTFTGTKGVDLPAQAAMVRQAVKDGYDGIAVDIIDPVAFDEVLQ